MVKIGSFVRSSNETNDNLFQYHILCGEDTCQPTQFARVHGNYSPIILSPTRFHQVTLEPLLIFAKIFQNFFYQFCGHVSWWKGGCESLKLKNSPKILQIINLQSKGPFIVEWVVGTESEGNNFMLTGNKCTRESLLVNTCYDLNS